METRAGAEAERMRKRDHSERPRQIAQARRRFRQFVALVLTLGAIVGSSVYFVHGAVEQANRAVYFVHGTVDQKNRAIECADRVSTDRCEQRAASPRAR
jgi:hypothetical protein